MPLFVIHKEITGHGTLNILHFYYVGIDKHKLRLHLQASVKQPAGTANITVINGFSSVAAHLHVTSVTCILSGCPVDSVLLAILTVSPKRQYRGIR
jgi:hypothetical protein